MELKVKLFADGAEKLGMLEMYNNPLISLSLYHPQAQEVIQGLRRDDELKRMELKKIYEEMKKTLDCLESWGFERVRQAYAMWQNNKVTEDDHGN